MLPVNGASHRPVAFLLPGWGRILEPEDVSDAVDYGLPAEVHDALLAFVELPQEAILFGLPRVVVGVQVLPSRFHRDLLRRTGVDRGLACAHAAPERLMRHRGVD